MNVYRAAAIPAGINRCESNLAVGVGPLISAKEVFCRVAPHVGVNAVHIAMPDVHLRARDRRTGPARVVADRDCQIERQAALSSGAPFCVRTNVGALRNVGVNNVVADIGVAAVVHEIPRVTFVACRHEPDEELLEPELLDELEEDCVAALQALSTASSTPAAPLAKITPPMRMTLRRLTSLSIFTPDCDPEWVSGKDRQLISPALRLLCQPFPSKHDLRKLGVKCAKAVVSGL